MQQRIALLSLFAALTNNTTEEKRMVINQKSQLYNRSYTTHERLGGMMKRITWDHDKNRKIDMAVYCMAEQNRVIPSTPAHCQTV
jgi:hypothetical protein